MVDAVKSSVSSRLAVCFIQTGGVLYFAYEPPLWLLIGLWGPLTIVLCLIFLYWLKGALIAQQFNTKAEQGQAELRKGPNHNQG